MESTVSDFNPLRRNMYTKVSSSDFVALTADEARAAGSISANRYSKALGDHRILEFQDEHPEIDITIRTFTVPIPVNHFID